MICEVVYLVRTSVAIYCFTVILGIMEAQLLFVVIGVSGCRWPSLTRIVRMGQHRVHCNREYQALLLL